MTLNDRTKRLLRETNCNLTGLAAVRATALFATALDAQIRSYAAETADDYTLAAETGDEARETNEQLADLIGCPTGIAMQHIKAAAYAVANGEDVL